MPERTAPTARVLDIGCGAGELLVKIGTAFPKADIAGVDPSEPMVEWSKAAVAPLGADGSRTTRIERGHVEALPFDDDTFDVIVSTGSVKNWADRRQGLREIARVARPGAHVFLSDLSRDAPASYVDRFVARYPIYWRWFFLSFPMRQALAFEEVDALMREGGFDDVKSSRMENTPFFVTEGVVASDGPEPA